LVGARCEGVGGMARSIREQVGLFHARSIHGSNSDQEASAIVDSVWSGIRRGIESNTPRSLPDLFRTSSRAASLLRGRHPARRPTIRKAACGTYRKPESSGVLCRNGDAVSGRDKGQTENIACRSELQCDRKGGLFTAAIGDGSRLHHDRA